MSTYTAQYTRPYADGYKDRPDESTPEYARYINARDDALLRIEAFLADLNIPSKLSELVNDEGFIKNTVSNLANYYLKTETYARTETYTQAEVQALIADAVSKVSGKLNISIVDALPTSDISTTTFYLVPKKKAEEKNLYDEYINTDGTESGWEPIGAVSTSVELSEYCKRTEVEALLAEKVNTSDLVASSFSGTKAIIGNQFRGGGTYVVSDIDYSTEEQLTGKRWIDGKPIYIRTLNIPSVSIGTTTIAVENIENLISYDGNIVISGSQRPFPFYQNGNTNKVAINECVGENILIVSYWDATDLKVNISYTKTTDTASSHVATPKVEAMHNYSTEEKVVGTWYDEKPLYEKGYYIDTTVILTTDWKQIIQVSEEIDRLVGSEISDIVYTNNMCLIKHENGYLKGLAPIISLGINAGSYITIQYTKTTDTATT